MIPDGVTSVGDWAFRGCTNLKSVTIPDSVTSIGDWAFYGCTSLQSVTIPDSVTSIESYAFENCKNLQSIIIPDSVTSIGKWAFYNCTSLQSIVIPDSVTSIGNWAFEGCTSLQSVTIGNGVKRVLGNTFSGCGMLRKVAIGSGVETISKTLFDGCPLEVDERGFAIVKNLLCRYQGDHTHIEIPEGVTDIKDHVFENLPNLETVKLPKTLKNIGKNFTNCPKLKISSVSEVLDLTRSYLTYTSGEMMEVEVLRLPENPRMYRLPENFYDMIDRSVLSDIMEKMTQTTAQYRPYCILFACVATEDAMERCVADISKHKKGQARYRYWAGTMTEAIYYSDTKAACEYIEKYGDFEKYVRMRGFSVQEYRDRQSLPDFGFDENGVKTYTVDGKTLEVRIGSDFALTLTDAEKGKAVRSISKKTEDGAKAAADYASLKKEIKEFFKKRIEYIKKIYITGEQISAGIWHDIYLKNPLFRPIIEKLLWMDENNTVFTVCDGTTVDIRNEPIRTAGNVRIAHILDMTADDIEAWRDFLVKHQKTLLIEQVWEPLADSDTNELQNRYNNVTLTRQERNLLKKRLNAKGIEVKSAEMAREYDYYTNTYVYYGKTTMQIGKYLTLTYSVDDETDITTLHALSYDHTQISPRERNTVMFELDRAAVRSYIETDHPEKLTETILSSFTVPQIVDFVDYATELGKTECVALLISFRTEHFADFNYLDLFVLEL